jgi:signal transduction histidine kinase
MRVQIKRISAIVGVSVTMTIALGVALLLLFFRGVLFPLRRMVEDASLFTTESSQSSTRDELRDIDFYLRTLMLNVTETRSNLERSRHQLIDAEKLASVGKLAASVAHEIRNPLASLKMRLFSIRRSIGENNQYQEDFQVISEEITHLEKIIRNFLEFSRPSALKLSAIDPSLLLDKTLELVGFSLEEKNIKLIRQNAVGLPPVMVDSEQIKQVFINLLRNSLEAINHNGEIQISTSLAADRDDREMVVVRFKDNGQGIPEDIKDQIFEPFFTTKDEGTGLGLCIAAQILARHGGRIELESSNKLGTTFAVWIPSVKGRMNEQNINR